MAARPDPAKDVEARRKYARAFNDTLLNIWEDRIIRLGVMDSMALLNSLRAVKFKINSDASVAEFSQMFLGYGIYQDAGTGRETAKGNPGDIGRPKVRKRRPWFHPKFYLSSRNIMEFFARSFGLQSMHAISNALTDESIRKNIY